RRRARASWLAAGDALAAPCWLRGDGWTLLLAALAATLLRRGTRRRWIRAGWLLAGAASCLLPRWGYELYALGARPPPAISKVSFMKEFADVFRYESEPSFAQWKERGVAFAWSLFLKAARSRIVRLPVEIPLPLLAMAVAGCLLATRRRWRDPRIA